MNIEQEIAGRPILPLNLNNQSNLFIQDYVLIQLLKGGEEYWVPGKVVRVPSPFASPSNLYTIQIHDPCPREVIKKNMK